jgi:hypothetical protein
MQTTPIDRKQRSRHRTTGHCLQTIQAKTSETQNISMEKSRYKNRLSALNHCQLQFQGMFGWF